MTDATALLLLENTGALPEETLAVSVADLPTARESAVLLRVISGDATVTVQTLVTPSSFTLMLAVPCFTARTVPFLLTVATELLLLRKVGTSPEEVLAVSLKLWPRYSVLALHPSAIWGFFTVTGQVTLVPSQDTVIIASPGFFAVMVPEAETLAMLDLLDLKDTVCPLEVVARRVVLFPFSMVMEERFRRMAVGSTVTLHRASAYLVLAVIYTSPDFLQVTCPFALTEAMALLLDLNLTVPLLGKAIKQKLPPIGLVALYCDSSTYWKFTAAADFVAGNMLPRRRLSARERVIHFIKRLFINITILS